MNSLYLLVNLGAFIVPFIFSFHPKLAFYKRWRFVWPAILLTAIPFIIWDSYFTKIGVWGFNPSYLLGFAAAGLPLEEMMFFICIPYSCMFTYHCLNRLVAKDVLAKYSLLITCALTLFLIAFSAIYSERLYTTTTFLALALVLIAAKFIVKAAWLSRFYFSYLILLFPFTIVNGILTGTGIDRAVVWYNDHENMGVRILTIPVEDIFYGMLLILLNILIYEALGKGGKGRRLNMAVDNDS